MRQLVAPQFDKATAALAIAGRPTLVTDGADLTTWYSSAASGPYALVMIDGSAAANLTAPAGGSGNIVELWGLFPFATGPLTLNGANFEWFRIGTLNQGNAIAIADDAHGYAEEFQHVGVARRVAIAATVSAGAATATFVPLETHDK